MIAGSSDSPPVATLTDLGFTELEARVYLHLVGAGPSTGYAVAKAIGKAGANTYKALESLRDKGAAELDEGEPRLCRATPPAELVARLRRDSARRLDDVERALERLETPRDDEGVYQLREAEQVVERARQIVRGAERAIVMDIFPALVRTLSDDLVAAAARGVSVVGILYESADLPGVEVILHTDAEEVRTMLAAEHVLLCADATHALLALVEPPDDDDWSTSGGVRQAISTSSPFVAWHLHDNLHHQLLTYALREEMEPEGPLAARIRDVYMRRLAGVAPVTMPGWRELLRRHGTAEGEAMTDRFVARMRDRLAGVRDETDETDGAGA